MQRSAGFDEGNAGKELHGLGSGLHLVFHSFFPCSYTCVLPLSLFFFRIFSVILQCIYVSPQTVFIPLLARFYYSGYNFPSHFALCILSLPLSLFITVKLILIFVHGFYVHFTSLYVQHLMLEMSRL